MQDYLVIIPLADGKPAICAPSASANMETGLVCILSSVPHVRAHVDAMAEQLVRIEQTSRSSFNAPLITWRTRTVSWLAETEACDAGSGTRLVLLGRVWCDKREMRSSALLRYYLSHGKAGFARLGGSFAILIWHPHLQVLEIVTDRLGTKKLYYWHKDGSLLLSTELRPLLGHPIVPRAIDEVAVGQFLVTSHLVDDCSLIRDVRILPPGAAIRVEHSAISFSYYWTPRISPHADDGLDAWGDRLADVLSSAVKAQCGDGPLLLPLSGGLDSRSVAAFVPASLAKAATACSFGHRHCYDVRYGRKVARALGASFKFLDIPEDFFRRYLRPLQIMCDGEVSIEASPMYRLLEAGQSGQIMPLGFLGDVLSGGHLLGLDHALNRNQALDIVWREKYQGKGFSEPLLERVLLPERYRAIKGRTRMLMETALENADAETLDEKALVVELHHRHSRYISYYSRLLSSRYRVENPFLDADVIDTFLAMPLTHRLGQRAYRRMLVRHAIRLALVPETKTHKPVTYADTHARGHAPPVDRRAGHLPAAVQWRVNNVRHALDHLLIAISGGWLGSHNRDYYVHHDESIRYAEPEWFRGRLLDVKLAADWFSVPALEGLFDEHMACKQDHSIRINNVISFLAWREAAGI